MAIKLKGSTDGSVTLEAPADTSPSGTNKTFSLPAADGTDGQVLSTNGSGALSFSSVPALAITEVDQWYLTADVSTDNADLTALARNNYEAAAQIGTGMSVSSGVFTFPSTGKWFVQANGMFVTASGDSINLLTWVSLDGGTNWDLVVFTTDGNGSGSSVQSSGSSCYFMDVTDTSLIKVKFSVNSINVAGTIVKGDTGRMETHFTFIRFGDT